MTQPSESPTYVSNEPDLFSPIKPLSLSFAGSPMGLELLTSPEAKEPPLEKKKRARNRGTLPEPPPNTHSLLSPSSDSLTTSITKMEISPSPPPHTEGCSSSMSSPSSPIYPIASLFPSHSSPPSPHISSMSISGSPTLRPLESLPVFPRKPSLTIITDEIPVNSLLDPVTAPPSIIGAFSAPPTPPSTLNRPRSTTAADSLRSIFSFPELEEMVNDDEFVNQRNPLRRSQSVGGRIEEEGGMVDLSQKETSEGLLPSTNECGVKRISADTTAALIRGEYLQKIDRYIIADCRYDYEYSGGHINTAVNTNSKQSVEALFQQHKEGSNKVVVIFHCEFSKHRGPSCCRHFRQVDREANSYPYLSFPEIYVLDGGYRAFHQKFPDMCFPIGYVSMWDPKYSKECKDRHKEFKKSWATTKSKRGGGGRSGARERGGERGTSSKRSLSRGRRLESIEDSGSPHSQLIQSSFGQSGRDETQCQCSQRMMECPLHGISELGKELMSF